MNLEKQKSFLIHFAYISLILGLAYISVKYVLPLLMPFVIGVIIAAILRPLIDGIQKKTRIKRSFIAIVILLAFYGILILIISMFGVKLFAFLEDKFNQLPTFYNEKLAPILNKWVNDLLLRYPEIEINLADVYNSISSSIASFVTTASSTVVGTITGFAGRVPAFLIRFLFTIVSSFFFTIDYHRIADFLLKQFSSDKREMVLRLKDSGIGTLGKFAKAYFTLITITFIELSIGFSILHVPNAILFGAIVAFVDILPILGTGAVLLPWILISLLFGNTSFAFGMLILYIVITVVRQTLEPKIVGQQIGLHPVATLFCMFLGAQLLGVLGLFLLPITVTILKKLNDEGTIHLLKY